MDESMVLQESKVITLSQLQLFSKCGRRASPRTTLQAELVGLVSTSRFYPKATLPTIIIPHGQNFTGKAVNSLSSLLSYPIPSQ